MIRTLTLLSVLSLFSLSAEAVSSSTVDSLDCSDSLSVSLLDTASFSCVGNLSLSGGGITSDSKIEITSSGSLVLTNLSIVAPIVELSSQNGQLSIGNGVLINTSSFLATVGSGVVPSFIVAPGASISLGSGEATRIIGSLEILESINHGAITPLVGGNMLINPSVPEPSAFISLLFGLLVVFGLTKGVIGTRYA